MYRLFIDLPLGLDQEQAQKIAKDVVQRVHETLASDPALSEMNYRLGNDEDRNKSNYLQINENGHVSTKKSRIQLI